MLSFLKIVIWLRYRTEQVVLSTILNQSFICLQISGEDFELQELIDAYDITLPSIRVFRRGIMADYRGPADTAGMAKYIMEDAKVCSCTCVLCFNNHFHLLPCICCLAIRGTDILDAGNPPDRVEQSEHGDLQLVQ